MDTPEVSIPDPAKMLDLLKRMISRYDGRDKQPSYVREARLLVYPPKPFCKRCGQDFESAIHKMGCK